MRNGPRAKQRDLVATINVTPFVDVLLVLLALTIVFASDLPGMQNNRSDNVAGALGGELENTNTVTLEIAGDGTLVLAGQVVQLEQVTPTLQQIAASGDRQIVVNVSSQQAVDYNRVFEVLQAISGSQAAGVTFSIYE